MQGLLERLKDGLPARLNRFRRVMFVEIDSDFEVGAQAVTSNISARGMAVICDADLQPGDEAWVRIGSADPMMARVVWRKGRRLGFRFEKEFDMVRSLGANISARRLVRSGVPALETAGIE